MVLLEGVIVTVLMLMRLLSAVIPGAVPRATKDALSVV